MFVALAIAAAFLALNRAGGGAPPPSKSAPEPSPAPRPATYTPPTTAAGTTDLDALRTGIEAGRDVVLAIVERF